MKFEESAINAVKKYSYEPASYDGRPVSSKASMVINFHLDDDVGGVSREFASRYKKASKELDKANPDLAKIDGVIQRLGSFKHATNYALARYSLIKLRRAMLTVDIEQQIEATRNLLLFDQKLSEDSRMLDLETFKTVRHSLFFLLVQTQRYVDALDLYDDIKKSDDSAALSLAETVKKIKSLRDSRNPSAISIKLGKRGYQLEKLFTNSLMLRDVEGELRSLSFRCDRHYAELDLLAETEYRIPSSWGDCLLEIAGKPETSATLVQF